MSSYIILSNVLGEVKFHSSEVLNYIQYHKLTHFQIKFKLFLYLGFQKEEEGGTHIQFIIQYFMRLYIT